MILKEKLYRNTAAKIHREKNPNSTGQLLLFIICGFMLGGSFSGGSIPLCTGLTAAVSPLNGMCLFMGSTVSYIGFSLLGDRLADVIAMPALVICKAAAEKMADKRLTPSSSALLSAIIYTLSGIAASLAYEITPIVMLASVFRGVLCGTISFFSSQCTEEYRSKGKLNITGEKSVGTAVLYVIAVSALSGAEIGNFCVGRILGIFVTLAAGGRFGIGGSAAAGVLAAMGMILGETDGTDLSDMIRSTALISCSGLISGYFSKKNRTASAVSFTVSMFVLIVFMERIQWAAALMSDTITAAALYCLIPDRLYVRFFSNTVRTAPVPLKYCGSRISLAANAISEIRRNVTEAADILKKQTAVDTDIPSEVCRRICGDCRNAMFCCKGSAHRTEYVFPQILGNLYANGFVTERELPKTLEGCHKKSELAECFNNNLRRVTMEQRNADIGSRVWETACSQLLSSEELLRSFAELPDDGRICDEQLSSKISALIETNGGKNASAAVTFDRSGHIFISAIFSGRLSKTVESVSEAVSGITDRDLDEPVLFSENGLTSVRWHELPVYYAEAEKAVCGSSEDVSGDRSASFRDGFGRVCHIISDGMGSGGRAALESSMTISVLTRLIRSGISLSAAVRTANLIMLSKSCDEVFSTIDLLCIDLFTGRTDIIKMGAAPTFVSTGGSVKSVESRNLPAGLLSRAEAEKRTLYLSDGDTAVMFSDGISESSYPKIRELMLSDGYSPSRCADAVIEYDKERQKSRPDDRTVIVVKMHKL
ncbi:MAG: SpoIIE family protein phosphatase [Oscillospiraceae bacterium]|nr:SpoIIE family protein phosphatase [Oscillospiraceae bacterium]